MKDKDVLITVRDACNKKIILEKCSFIFCHASYEARSTSVLNFIEAANGAIPVICSSEEFLSYSIYQKNKAALSEGLAELTSNEPTDITVGRDENIHFLEELDSLMKKRDPELEYNYFIDIATFPRDRMICLLDYLIRISPKDNKIRFLYTSPERYGSQKESGWLSKGVRKMAAIPRFNGKQKSNRGALLVMLLGHEGERAHITLRNTEPDKVIIISQGEIQANSNTLDVCEASNHHIIHEYQHCLEKIYTADYSSPNDVKNIISEIYCEYSDSYNISVSINGTKLQVLGAMLACMKHRAIEIIYAYPQAYNINDYSSSTGGSVLGELRF